MVFKLPSVMRLWTVWATSQAYCFVITAMVIHVRSYGR